MISMLPCPTSCGVQLLRGEQNYKTPETYFKDLVAQSWMDSTYTQFMYTHSETIGDIGDKIAEYIHKHSLGFVVKSRAGNNPVHGRNITVWVWTRDNIGFMKHKELLCASKGQKTAEPTILPEPVNLIPPDLKTSSGVSPANAETSTGIGFSPVSSSSAMLVLAKARRKVTY